MLDAWHMSVLNETEQILAENIDLKTQTNKKKINT